MERDMVTLGELVDHPDLGISFVTGPDDALFRTVAGVYIAKDGEEIHWPGPDWVMLADHQWSSHLEAQRLVVHGTAKGNLCAVAMRNGDVHESTILEAKHAEVALLTVRSDVPYRLITYFVERRLLQEDSDLHANLHAAQWSLTDAISVLGVLSGGVQVSESIRKPSDLVTLAEWLVGSADPDELRRRVRQRFGQLRNFPELSETLGRWLAEDRNVRAAAASMHIHANTLRYRLSRIEELTSCKLSDVSDLADLYLSLLAFPGELGMPTGNG
jgi:hypothetical protein